MSNVVILPSKDPLRIRVAVLEEKLAREKEIVKQIRATYQDQVVRLLEIINRLEYQIDEMQEEAESALYAPREAHSAATE